MTMKMHSNKEHPGLKLIDGIDNILTGQRVEVVLNVLLSYAAKVISTKPTKEAFDMAKKFGTSLNQAVLIELNKQQT